MGTITVTFSDADGSVREVIVEKDQKDNPKPNVKKIPLGEVTLEHYEPTESFQQSVTMDFVHKPGRSICSIVIGGYLFRWC